MVSVEPVTSALALGAALRRRDLKAVDLLEACLARMDWLDPIVNAIAWRDDVAARAWALEADHQLACDGTSRSLLGVPVVLGVGHKVAGWPAAYGPYAPERETEPATDDPVVAQIRAAGLVPCALAGSPSLGASSATEHLARERTRNPWNLGRSAGGSLGGGSAAVAASMAPVAFGSDIGGSLRIAASCTNLVGLKPSRARVPVDVMMLEGFSCGGTITHTVADSAIALDVIARRDNRGWYGLDVPAERFANAVASAPRPLRIGISLRGLCEAPVAGASRDAVGRAADLLTSLGHDVVSWDIPYEDDLAVHDDYLRISQAGTAGLDPGRLDLAEPHERVLYERARLTTAADHVASSYRLQLFTRRVLASWLGSVDVLITPTLGIEPPPVGWMYEGADDDPEGVLSKTMTMASFTVIASILGVPAITLPLQLSDDGLPVGVQLLGSPQGEFELLQLAARIEDAVPWHDRRPPELLSVPS